MSNRDETLTHVRTALRICLEDRFEPGKELSEHEFDGLAVRLFDDQMSGKPDAAKILNEFLDQPGMAARKKIYHLPRYRLARVPMGIFERIRECLRTGKWEEESVKYIRVTFGEPGYDEAPFDGTGISCRDILNYPC